MHAIAKEIQWTKPDDLGDEKFMMGDRHTEMTSMKCLGMLHIYYRNIITQFIPKISPVIMYGPIFGLASPCSRPGGGGGGEKCFSETPGKLESFPYTTICKVVSGITEIKELSSDYNYNIPHKSDMP